MRLVTNAYIALNTRYFRPNQSARKLKDLTRIDWTLLTFATEEGGAGMSTVKTFYAQVPLAIAMKKIELHEQSELSESSHEENKRIPEPTRPVRKSAGKGAERVQPMSN
jgi:hypothetical protein